MALTGCASSGGLLNSPRLLGQPKDLNTTQVDISPYGFVTVDYLLSGTNSDSTVIYFPGCNGKTFPGSVYQGEMMQRIREQFNGNVNIVTVQFVDDLNKKYNRRYGICDVAKSEPIYYKINSYDWTHRTVDVIQNWVKKQSWFNGNLHYWGFSFGGRTALVVSSLERTKGMFKSIIAIQPLCNPKDIYENKLWATHTPTRIYSYKDDPVTVPTNCHNMFEKNADLSLLEYKLYPGSYHGHISHGLPFGSKSYWPILNVTSYSGYNERYATDTYESWFKWAKCLEKNSVDICK